MARFPLHNKDYNGVVSCEAEFFVSGQVCVACGTAIRRVSCDTFGRVTYVKDQQTQMEIVFRSKTLRSG